MANEFYISAGLIPIDNSSGTTADSFYIAAGLVPTDTNEEEEVPDNAIMFGIDF